MPCLRFLGTVAECVCVCAQREGRWGWVLVAGNRGQEELIQERSEKGGRGLKRPIQGMLASALAVKKEVKEAKPQQERGRRARRPVAVLAASSPASRAQLRIVHRSAFTPEAQPG